MLHASGSIAEAALLFVALSNPALGVPALGCWIALRLAQSKLNATVRYRFTQIFESAAANLEHQVAKALTRHRGLRRNDLESLRLLGHDISQVRTATSAHLPFLLTDPMTFLASAVGALVIVGVSPWGVSLAAGLGMAGGLIFHHHRRALRLAEPAEDDRRQNFLQARKTLDHFLDADMQEFYQRTGRTASALEQLRSRHRAAAHHSSRFAKIRFSMGNFQEGLSTLLFAGTIGAVLTGGWQIAMIPVALGLTNQAILAVRNIPENLLSLQPGLRASENLTRFASLRPRIAEPTHSRQIDTRNLQISIHNATIQFDENPLLRKLDFSLRDGEVVALTGANGTGKTSVLRLLSRRDDPEQGQVVLGSTDIRELSFADIDRTIAYLPARSVMLPGSAYHNVSIANPRAGHQRIAQALRVVGLERFAADTTAKLPSASSGEAQRIELARLLLADARVLLIDEPTSHLDSGRTDLLAAFLAEARRLGKTVVFAVHDPATVKLADRHLHLQNGTCHEITTKRAAPVSHPARHTPHPTMRVPAGALATRRTNGHALPGPGGSPRSSASPDRPPRSTPPTTAPSGGKTHCPQSRTGIDSLRPWRTSPSERTPHDALTRQVPAALGDGKSSKSRARPRTLVLPGSLSSGQAAPTPTNGSSASTEWALPPETPRNDTSDAPLKNGHGTNPPLWKSIEWKPLAP